jgi:hypothetical protein
MLMLAHALRSSGEPNRGGTSVSNGNGSEERDTPSTPSGRELYREELLRLRIQAGEVARGPGYLYRPGEILVATGDEELVQTRLKCFGVDAEPHDRPSEGVLQVRIGQDHSVPELLALLRQPRSGDRPVVSANHILTGTSGNVTGGPFSFSLPASEPDDLDPNSPGARTVGVLDTGIALRAGAPEHPLLAKCLVVDPAADNEVRDQHPADSHLDDEAGHGTFCAGVVIQRAPYARVAVHRVLASDGFAAETDVAKALRILVEQAQPDILSLSFGGYTDGDAPLLALGDAIGSLHPDVVVVAAAGNHGEARPFWPAAQKRVIAVGALQSPNGPASGEGGQGLTQPAPYSNYGWWVDAWAAGDWISSFFVEADDTRFTLPGPGHETVGPRDFDGWARWDGTSFATPAVAGSIAAYAEANHVTPRQAAFELIEAAGLPRVSASKGGGAIIR